MIQKKWPSPEVLDKYRKKRVSLGGLGGGCRGKRRPKYGPDLKRSVGGRKVGQSLIGVEGCRIPARKTRKKDGLNFNRTWKGGHQFVGKGLKALGKMTTRPEGPFPGLINRWGKGRVSPFEGRGEWPRQKTVETIGSQ